MKKCLPWIAAIVITLGVGSVAGQSYTAETPAPQPKPYKHYRDIPAGVCPAGHVGIWLAESRMQCFKELP